MISGRRVVTLALALLPLLPGPVAGQRLRLPESRRDLERRVVADSNDAAAHYNLALAFWNDRRWGEVERHLREALEFELGVTLGMAGQFAEADSVLSVAAQRAPRDSRVPYFQGVVASASGDSTRAIAALERFLAIAPSRYATRIADARRRLDALR